MVRTWGSGVLGLLGGAEAYLNLSIFGLAKASSTPEQLLGCAVWVKLALKQLPLAFRV